MKVVEGDMTKHFKKRFGLDVRKNVFF